MAYIEPNTTIKFLKDVPLDPDYENTLYFDNLAQQTNYFYSKAGVQLDKQSYQRDGRGWLKVGWNADATGSSVISTLFNSSYMMFKNTNFENKWFYAFVDRVEYVNNNTVRVRYHLDVMQTWFFDYTFNQCLIEREHVQYDAPGAHTIPEQLETGPYMETKALYTMDGNLNNSGQFEFTPALCLVTSFDPSELYDSPVIGVDPIPGRIIYGTEIHGNIYSGAYYSIWELTGANVALVNDVLDRITITGKVDGIVSIFMFPYEFRNSILDTAASAYKDLEFSKPTNLGTYVPRNKKLLTHPYNFLYVSNNQGGHAEYAYEYFADDVELRLWGNVSPDGGMYCWPLNYKGISHRNDDEVLSLTGFPMCSWSYDAYKAWVSQNAGTLGGVGLGLLGSWASLITAGAGGDYLGLLGGAGGSAGALGTGGQVSGLLSGGFGGGGGSNEVIGGVNIRQPSSNLLVATLGAIGQVFDHKRRPPQAVGSGNIPLQYQAALMTFNFYTKHIMREYAEIIDKYFDMYGYKVNRVGTPSRMRRRCYTYLKTIGCSIHGNLPSEDSAMIQSIYNNGIRFWRSTASFGNYDPAVNDNTL